MPLGSTHRPLSGQQRQPSQPSVEVVRNFLGLPLMAMACTTLPEMRKETFPSLPDEIRDVMLAHAPGLPVRDGLAT